MNKRIPFVEWLPDQPIYNNPMYRIQNLIPDGEFGYAPYVTGSTQFSGTIVLSAATSTSAVMDAQAFTDGESTDWIVFGSKDKLWLDSSFAATSPDVSATTYSTPTAANGGMWDFAQWKDNVVATNFTDPMQTMAFGATAMSDVNAATSTPRARYVTAARNFLIIGNTWDTTDATSPYRVRWSAIGDFTDWTVSSVTESDYNDLSSGDGPIMRVFGGETCVVFQERAIHLMTYIGTPEIWKFDKISSKFGLFAPRAAAQVDNRIFYLSHDGFYMLEDGVRVIPIGDKKVNHYAKYVLPTGTNKYQIQCVADPGHSRVFWFFHITEATYGVGDDLNYAFVYDYATNKWGYVTVDPAIWTDPITAVVPFQIYSSGNASFTNVIAGITQAQASGTYSASGRLNAFYQIYGSTPRTTHWVQTGRMELTEGRSSLVHSIHAGIPTLGGSNRLWATVIGHDNEQGTNAATVTSATVTNARMCARKNGRFHIFRVDFDASQAYTGGFVTSPITHLDIEYNETSMRRRV